MLFARHEIRLLEWKRVGFQGHGLIVIQELLAHAKEIGFRRYPANLMKELTGWFHTHT